MDPPLFHISYDDGNQETLNRDAEVWRYISDPVFTANSIKLVSNEKTDLKEFLKFLG